MNLEHSQKRSPVPYKYVFQGSVLHIHLQIVAKTYAVLAPYREAGVESVCFWYGERQEQREEVKAVLIVDQENNPGNFRVIPESMMHVAKLFGSFGWTNLAQIHTHPGRDVEHSRYDDVYVNSRRAVSLVLPSYGAPERQFMTSIGVHEYQDYWYLLSPDDKVRRIVTDDNASEGAVIDVRTYRLG